VATLTPSQDLGPDQRVGMFTLADGRRVGVTFALVTSLFLLWGFCNGMIDVMDKHFQQELHLTLAQSAWVQFAHYFFMSIIFPTIFALGIHDLGGRAKQASAFIVMAIMGGAVLPKLMGYVADHSDMSRAFAVPLACFAVVALYAWRWPSLSGWAGLPRATGSRSSRDPGRCL
jgi:fucose permease